MGDLHVMSELQRKQGGNSPKSALSSAFGAGQLLPLARECYCVWAQFGEMHQEPARRNSPRRQGELTPRDEGHSLGNGCWEQSCV